MTKRMTTFALAMLMVLMVCVPAFAAVKTVQLSKSYYNPVQSISTNSNAQYRIINDGSNPGYISVQLVNSTNGSVVLTTSLGAGQQKTIPVAPGAYRIDAKALDVAGTYKIDITRVS